MVQCCLRRFSLSPTTSAGVKCHPGLDPNSLGSPPPLLPPCSRDVTPLTDWRLSLENEEKTEGRCKSTRLHATYQHVNKC